ncbi:hypothetical protein SAMN05444920_14226 [Nonomuraea solani]|uniref:Uncharacterized protein n=1 Tax=Nonomuraea solani TaxID=1144553 RepID=A0A1H6F0L4_9ACTN|nr:hypothetical protein [Nonomuraea solani]SEH03708.1 hypothetical protein SAMN05444920_14226 [Nonomuraea solani]
MEEPGLPPLDAIRPLRPGHVRVRRADDRTLRGVGGSFWGFYFFAVGTPDGRHTVTMHTNTEWKSWDPMFKVIEAEFGVSIGA